MTPNEYSDAAFKFAVQAKFYRRKQRRCWAQGFRKMSRDYRAMAERSESQVAEFADCIIADASKAGA